VHPYLVARSEGAAVLDGLRATVALARQLDVPISGRHAIVGLSQGGHAALAAAAMHAGYAPELELRAVAVSGPATVWERHWAKGATVAGWHVPLHAMLLYAWAAHYGWKARPLWTDATAELIDEVMTTRCVWTAPSLLEGLPHDPAQVFAPGLLAEYASGEWDVYREVHDAFVANAIGPYRQTAPLRVYQGDADDVVPEWATREVIEALRAGGVEVDYQVVPGGGHADVAFGFVATPQQRTDESIAWVRARLDD
jgi:pimeloyl-ACP methyl ester carboxylesterase